MTRKLLAALLAVGISWLAACGGSGGDDTRELEGEAAVQGAVQATVSLVGAIQALLGDPAAGLTANASAAGDSATTAAAGESMTDSRAIEILCERGGSVDGECREEGGRTFVDARLQNCSEFNEELGVVVTADGVSNAVFEATGVCGNAVPEGVDSRFELRDYREEWRIAGELVRVLESDRLTQTFEPSDAGCSFNDGEAFMDGDLLLQGPGFDWALRMGDLRFSVSSQGEPCDETAVIDGGLTVDDAIRGALFDASLDGLVVDTRVALDGVSEVAVDGVVDFDCIGPVDIQTGERLALLGACPVEGVLGVAPEGFPAAAAAFFSDGLLIDYDGDGESDFSADGCGVESLATCG